MAKDAIAELNGRLKAGRIGVAVELRGGQLSLRATLPPRPGGAQPRPYQQRIALGIPATATGLAVAEAKARQIRNDLIMGRFDWGDWLEDLSGESAGSWIDRYKANAIAQVRWADLSDRERLGRWKKDYWHCGLQHLNQLAPVDQLNCQRALEHYQDGSRSKQLARQRLLDFAKFCGVDFVPEGTRRSYSLAKVERTIPSDRVIIEQWSRIPEGSPWRNFYALVATYGLRAHEVFSGQLEWLEVDSDRVLAFRVSKDGKTGERIVPPVPLSWLTMFKVEDVEVPLPEITSHFGQRATRQFKRFGIPFTTYALRHAYSLRCNATERYGSTVTAQFMGHSPAINQQVYQRHMDSERAWEAWRSSAKKKDQT